MADGRGIFLWFSNGLHNATSAAALSSLGGRKTAQRELPLLLKGTSLVIHFRVRFLLNEPQVCYPQTEQGRVGPCCSEPGGRPHTCPCHMAKSGAPSATWPALLPPAQGTHRATCPAPTGNTDVVMEYAQAPSLICLFICLLNTLLYYLLSFSLLSRDQESEKRL